MALTMLSSGAVAGLDTHPFTGVCTAAQGRYHNRLLRVSNQSVVQETLLHKSLVVNASTSKPGKSFGSDRHWRRSLGSGSKRGVCRCAGSENIDKNGSNYDEEKNEKSNDGIPGTSGSGNKPQQKKPQVRALAFYIPAQRHKCIFF